MSAKSGDSGIPAAQVLCSIHCPLDATSQLNSTQVQDAQSLPNLRSPNLDLDCVYAFGPEASEYLYDGTGRLSVGNSQNPNDWPALSPGGMSGGLGPLGSAIPLEVFSGVLSLCADSFLAERRWSPSNEVVGGDQQQLSLIHCGFVGRY
ncbi:MAG: hypothetical protein KDB22_24895 [Planctomycetales bacterium]|nr:hypothetical protein [Planctomycetales bacterium]